MSTLMKASNQWASRPADQRFTSLTDMHAFALQVRENSKNKVLANRAIEARPVEGDHKALVVVGPNGTPVAPTHWSFGQLAQRAVAPAGYLRDLPAEIAADCINYGLARRDVEEIGILLTANPEADFNTMAACTGPNYGRIWNSTIIGKLVEHWEDSLSPIHK